MTYLSFRFFDTYLGDLNSLPNNIKHPDTQIVGSVEYYYFEKIPSFLEELDLSFGEKINVNNNKNIHFFVKKMLNILPSGFRKINFKRDIIIDKEILEHCKNNNITVFLAIIC